MKSILLILLINFSSYNNDIQSVRKLFISAPISFSNCEKFGEKLKSINGESTVLLKGYEGCFYFIRCKFIDNPIKRIIYFNKGKKLLETAIKLEPYSIELKFLRYVIQKNLPKFLLYANNIEKDLNFVNENINKTKSMETKKYIYNSLNSIN